MEACPRLTFEGFMTMAPFSESPEDARPCFRRLRELRDATEKKFGLVLPRLSMGMSGDYEVAVEEGATWLRLGTALFGERPKVKAVRAAADDPPPHQGSAGRSAVRSERTAPLPCGARPARPQRDSPRPRGGQVGRLRPFQRLDARLSGIWTRPFARVHRVRQRLRLRRAAARPHAHSGRRASHGGGASARTRGGDAHDGRPH